MPEARTAPLSVVLVTGMSGAGNSTAIRALEDAGHEAIDNLPLSFVDRLFPRDGATAPEDPRPLALGLDVRTRGFSAAALLDSLFARDDQFPVFYRLLDRVVFMAVEVLDLLDLFG